MAWFAFFWTDERVEHLAEHGITTEDFEQVVSHPESEDISRSSGRLIAFGYTYNDRYIACVYEFLDDVTVLPVTAYEVEP